MNINFKKKVMKISRNKQLTNGLWITVAIILGIFLILKFGIKTQMKIYVPLAMLAIVIVLIVRICEALQKKSEECILRNNIAFIIFSDSHFWELILFFIFCICDWNFITIFILLFTVPNGISSFFEKKLR